MTVDDVDGSESAYPASNRSPATSGSTCRSRREGGPRPRRADTPCPDAKRQYWPHRPIARTPHPCRLCACSGCSNSRERGACHRPPGASAMRARVGVAGHPPLSDLARQNGRRERPLPSFRRVYSDVRTEATTPPAGRSCCGVMVTRRSVLLELRELGQRLAAVLQVSGTGSDRWPGPQRPATSPTRR